MSPREQRALAGEVLVEGGQAGGGVDRDVHVLGQAQLGDNVKMMI